MKRNIKNGLLHYGGYKLSRTIRDNWEYHSLLKRHTKFLISGVTPNPDRVMLEATHRCNQSCIMCFQRRHPSSEHRELSAQEIDSFFEQNTFLQKVTLIGGEIFIRDDMLDIIKKLHDRNRDIVLCTNATLLEDRHITALKQYNRIYTICISLDGPQAIHDSIRNVDGSYEKTIRSIKALAPHFPITVNAVIQEINIEFLLQLTDICVELKIKKLKLELERLFIDNSKCIKSDNFTEDINNQDSTASHNRQFSPALLAQVLRECFKRGKKNGIFVAVDPPFLMDDVESCYYDRLRHKRKFICQSLRTATISPNGDVIHCLMLRKSFGNILEKPFDEIWNSEKAINFRRHLLHNNMTSLCENCPFMIPLKKKHEWDKNIEQE